MAAGLTVGDFSRATHLSVKTLRHYHEVGLLAPATVNPDTGYRYYSAGQIPAAQVIRRLRDLGMPVAEVNAVLAAPDAPARSALIASHLNRLETELAQTRAAVESLRNLLQPPDGATAIEHRSVPAAAAAAIGAVVGRADILAWWQGALGELRATVRAQGLHATGPSGGVYASELFQHDRGEATVFIPVQGRVRSIGRVTPLTVPAAELAIISHHGSLSDADLSYAKLGSYATTHEISIDGPLREYYLRGAEDTPDEAEWRTEIGWPIFRADGSPV
ncbi:MAG TPA: MerR family transcriptional regulator [Streptosporangiaceae bacterium]|nr:MerR family transcriptional regulator [Streptosporangiaceae bacterium]